MPTNMTKSQGQGCKTVAISDATYTAVVESHRETWYTHEEMDRMQLEMLHEVRRLSRLLSTSPESFTKAHQLQCVGIENYVIPAIAKQARQERREHERLILRAQRVVTDKDLSILSNKSSASACQRAYMFANSIFCEERGLGDCLQLRFDS